LGKLGRNKKCGYIPKNRVEKKKERVGSRWGDEKGKRNQLCRMCSGLGDCDKSLQTHRGGKGSQTRKGKESGSQIDILRRRGGRKGMSPGSRGVKLGEGGGNL